MRAVALFPGTMGLCGLAIEVFGVENVRAGVWLGPVYLVGEDHKPEDVTAAIDLIKEEAMKHGVTITAVDSVLPC